MVQHRSILQLLLIYAVSFVGKSKESDKPRKQPNLLVIVLDQLRFDTLGVIQESLPIYQGKLQIRTPNIDRLSTFGATFTTTYCASPSCGPARASIKTGCTVQRHGVTANELINEESCYKPMPRKAKRLYKARINAMLTFEQLLVEEMNYTAETYGKWHAPWHLTRARDNLTNIIAYDDINYETKINEFNELQIFTPAYQRVLDFLLKVDGYPPVEDATFQGRQQPNSVVAMPYEPARLDARYDYPPGTPMKALPSDLRGEDKIFGHDLLSLKYTQTGILGQMAVDALDRLLLQESKPFVLGVHFNSPHPPYLAISPYFEYYYKQRDRLLVPPSLEDPMENSGYSRGNDYGFNNSDLIAEFTAVYYASIEEVDHWVGELLDKVYAAGQQDSTLIIFTSDHGEMLGSHGLKGKWVLLEESARVPLIVSFPGPIPAGTNVTAKVSTMDLHATILDYLGASEFDQSDGTSLRRHIERTSFNQDYDENTVVVSEYSGEYASVFVNKTALTGKIGGAPNFMIRKDSYKLIVPRMSDSHVRDMMYDLDSDPFEMNNLLGENGSTADEATIGKAEHLKLLLLEWMERHDGQNGYFSDPKYELNEGLGNIEEITRRRTWRKLDYWQSDQVLVFGTPSLLADKNGNAQYVRNEYLYVGRTLELSNPLVLDSIAVEGKNSSYFTVDTTSATIERTGYVRIKVSFSSQEEPIDSPLDARIVVRRESLEDRKIPIEWEHS